MTQRRWHSKEVRCCTRRGHRSAMSLPRSTDTRPQPPSSALGLPFVVSWSPHSSRLGYLPVAPLGRTITVQPRWAQMPCPLRSATLPSPMPVIGNPPSRPHSCRVQAEGAIDYFTLRAVDAQSDLLAQTAVAYQRALELTQNRHRAGIASDLDVAQAETQLKSAKAQIPAMDLQRAQLRHALAVLCGQPATAFALTPGTTAATNLPAIPLSVPSEWLESRPDISGAERKMAAANADIGVAKAAFYPRVFLNGSGGFESIRASDLFNWPSHLWAIGPTLQLPIFTGGRNRAQLTSARAAYDGAVALYRQTVLAAFQDVEAQLAAQKPLALRLNEENAALASAQRTLDTSNNRYNAGVEPYLDVITAQTTALAHEQSVIQLNGQRLAASVSLIKSLGAGWKQPASLNRSAGLAVHGKPPVAGTAASRQRTGPAVANLPRFSPGELGRSFADPVESQF